MTRLPCEKIGLWQQDLRPRQEAYLRQITQEYVAAHLACTEIDKQGIEAHLRELYRVAGYDLPPVRWFDSPLAFVYADYERVKDDIIPEDAVIQMAGWWKWWMMAMYLRRRRESLFLAMKQVVYESLGGDLSLGGGKIANLCNILCGGMLENVWENRSSLIEENSRLEEKNSWSEWHRYLYNQELGDELWDYARKSVCSLGSLEDQVLRRFCHEVYKRNDCTRIGFYEQISGFRLGSRQVWIVQKPIQYHFDDQMRLHNESGPCVEYRDGWKLYAWHGVRVPEKVIFSPESLTRDDWLRAANVTTRRVIQERMPNFIEQVGARFINRDTRGSLYEVDLPDNPEKVAHYVQVRDPSTDHIYYLRVPPSIQRANEAVAWTFGMSEQDYQPEQES